jgi:acyl dehydratase
MRTSDPAARETLPPHEVTARNYAVAHDNKIHGDETAARYGFRGGLVPGIALYAYLAHPVISSFGIDYLARASITAKFVSPVYDGERVIARARVEAAEPLRLELELRNAEGAVCAVGTAGVANDPPPRSRDYPSGMLKDGAKRPATIESLDPGTVLAPHEFTLDLEAIAREFISEIGDDDPIYHGSGAAPHPARLLAAANEIVSENFALGPWIHAASAAQHYGLARDGERLALRGRVAAAYARRGHELVDLDLALFGEGDRPLARFIHTAIIRLREHPVAGTGA